MTQACVVIPCFNVARTIGPIVRELKKQNIDVLVVDDGSSDLTAEIADESGAIVLKNRNNCGKGASLRRGFDYALDKGYDLLIAMDGDGQHLSGDVTNFLKAHNAYPDVDIIIGNRMNQPLGMPLIRRLTNRFMSALLSWLSHQYIPDSQNGFRLLSNRILKGLELKSDRFEIESEIILAAVQKGAKIISIPISSVYKNHPSRISPLFDTLRFIKFIRPCIIDFCRRSG